MAEFSELRTYLIAKLLWNPDCDIDSVMNDFLYGYYGPAAAHIRAYIDTMHDALETLRAKLDIYGYPFDAINSYLTPDLLGAYSSCSTRPRRAVRKRSRSSWNG